MKSQIILVDDNWDEVAALAEELQTTHRVEFTSNPYDILELKLDPFQSDALVVDVHMPAMSGFALVKRVIGDSQPAPAIFFLSSDEREETVLSGLNLMRADYLRKTDSPKVNAARVRNALDRGESARSYGNLEYSPRDQSFRINGQLLDLTKIESRALACAVNGKGTPVSREEFIRQVWEGKSISEQTMRSHLSNLNRKLTGWTYRITADRESGIRIVEG